MQKCALNPVKQNAPSKKNRTDQWISKFWTKESSLAEISKIHWPCHKRALQKPKTSEFLKKKNFVLPSTAEFTNPQACVLFVYFWAVAIMNGQIKNTSTCNATYRIIHDLLPCDAVQEPLRKEVRKNWLICASCLFVYLLPLPSHPHSCWFFCSLFSYCNLYKCMFPTTIMLTHTTT